MKERFEKETKILKGKNDLKTTVLKGLAEECAVIENMKREHEEQLKKIDEEINHLTDKISAEGKKKAT